MLDKVVADQGILRPDDLGKRPRLRYPAQCPRTRNRWSRQSGSADPVFPKAESTFMALYSARRSISLKYRAAALLCAARQG